MRFPENNVRKRGMIFFFILNALKVRQFEIKSGLKREGTKKKLFSHFPVDLCGYFLFEQ